MRTAIKEYLKLDEKRRRHLHSDGADAFIFQPLVNYRTLEFNKPLSTRMVWNIVARWGNWGGVGKLSPHDLRRTAITRARPGAQLSPSADDEWAQRPEDSDEVRSRAGEHRTQCGELPAI